MAWEKGWVIERENSPVFAPEYLVLDGQVRWSKVSTEAMRFARCEDAKAFSDTFFGGGGRLAEHGWGP